MLKNLKKLFSKKFNPYKYALFFLLALTLFFSLSHPAFALKTELNYPNIVPFGGFGLSESPTIGEMIQYFFELAVVAAGLLGVLSITIAGISLLTSVGNPSAVGDARDRIFSAVLGIILLMFSFILLQTINPELVKVQNLNLQQEKGVWIVKKKGAPAYNNNPFGIGVARAAALSPDDYDFDKKKLAPETYENVDEGTDALLVNICDPATDPPILINVTSNSGGDDTVSLDCFDGSNLGESSMLLDNVDSYDWHPKEPGVYLFTGEYCINGDNDSDDWDFDNNPGSNKITSDQLIDEQFRGKVKSVLIVNGDGKNDPKFGAVFSAFDGTSDCSEPYINWDTPTSTDQGATTESCFNITTSSSCPTNNPPPPPPQTHLECQNQSCVQVSGAGSDSCTVSPNSCAPPPPQTHLACQNQSCVQVSGAGSDSCTVSPNSCAPPPPPGTYRLTVTKLGTGTGTVKSPDIAPFRIDCGSDCFEDYAPNTFVTLTATADANSSFVGWNGCSASGTTCTTTMNSDKAVSAIFNANPKLLTVTKAGNGNGTVASAPAGINCGTDCFESYNHGTIVNLTASADQGSTFTGWSGAGCAGTGGCSITMDAAKLVTATFTQSNPPPNSFTLNVSKAGTGSGTVTGTNNANPPGPNINCEPTCSANYQDGTTVTLTATTPFGSTFSGWSGSGCSGTGTCTVTMTQARSVTATFNLAHVLTVNKGVNPTGTGTVTSSPSGINCDTNCNSTSFPYAQGTLVTLTRTNSPGSTFGGWSGPGVSCGAAITCDVTMDAAKTVTARFNLSFANYSLNVGKSGTGTGTVIGTNNANPPGPNINCEPTCNASYLSGTGVTLAANPSPGSFFAGWGGPQFGATVCSGTGLCNITMYQNHRAHAIFNSGSGPTPPTVTLTANPSVITSGASSTLTWTVGNATSCVASGDWSGARSATGGTQSVSPTITSTYTITCTGPGGSASASATVIVLAATHTLTVILPNLPGSGSTSPASGIYTYANNTLVNVAANPSAGYTFQYFLVDGVAQYINNPYQILMNTSHTIQPFFTQNAPNLPTVSLTANPGTITSGASSTLTWTVGNATSCTASANPATGQWTGAKSTSGGTQSVSPTITTTYTLACTNSNGTTTRSVTVNVNATGPPVVGITATPASLPAGGGTSTLDWSVTNANSCTASANEPTGEWTGPKDLIGTEDVSPTETTIYKLTCTGSNGTTTGQVMVTVEGSQPPATAQNPIRAKLAVASTNPYQASLSSMLLAVNAGDGCTDPAATNYDPNATQDDGSCTYASSNGSSNNSTCASFAYIHILRLYNEKLGPVDTGVVGTGISLYAGTKYLNLSAQDVGRQWTHIGDINDKVCTEGLVQPGYGQDQNTCNLSIYPAVQSIIGRGSYTSVVYTENENTPTNPSCYIFGNIIDWSRETNPTPPSGSLGNDSPLVNTPGNSLYIFYNNNKTTRTDFFTAQP